jgi:hypothetical protein
MHMPTTGPVAGQVVRALVALAVLLLALTGCGGGGGGGSGTGGGVGGGGGGGGDAVTTVTISGKAEFESVPGDTTTGGLNYAAASYKPIRAATVQIVGAASGTTLASGTTDASGNFSLSVNSGQSVFVRVRAESVRTGSGGGQWDLSVRDNTSGNAIYVLDGASFTTSGTAITANLRAASGWGGSAYTQTRSAAPFAILDVAYDGVQKVLATVPNSSFPPLRLFWSANNRPVNGELTQGLIGTSFYRFSDSQHQIYILGAADTDTDEYDRMVVAHEFGHYLQAVFSRNDSIGGPHTGEDKLDMRVAFSEGFGNAWSGMLFNTPLYQDSLGAGQRRGGLNNLTDVPTNRGWFSEDTVQYLLYAWNGDTGISFAPLWDVLRNFNATLGQAGALSTLHSFAHQLKLQVPSRAAAIDSALAAQQVTVTDALGTGETNNGGIAQALPVYRTLALGTAQNACVTDAAAVGSEESNKLGATTFFRINLPAAGTRRITVSATTTGGGVSSDPDFRVVRPDGVLSTHDTGTTASEEASLSLSAGWHVITLYDYNLTSSATGTTQSGVRCFDITVQ